MYQPEQSSRIDGEHNSTYQSGRDVRVHNGDRNRHFSLRGLGLAVLAAGTLGVGGVTVYHTVVAGSGPSPAAAPQISDAVGHWVRAASGSVGDMPSTLDVAADGTFALDITVVWNLGAAEGLEVPSMALACRGEVTPQGDRLVFSTTAGPCGAMGAKVLGTRIDLTVDPGQGEQVLSLTRQ
ncbi:hypothetical protein AB0I60_10495 [Actinosynnema sp. NPDC050436]|uniref:hypothetical protein n=1 Tax=Actinosynnema sp. NPDC050436 TaxID=3155659 RepID=UPI0033EBCE69